MQPRDADPADDLSSRTESDYGGGTELAASGFLVLGLISYWTYTVWKYHQLLCRHLAARLAYFRERLDADTLPPEARRVYDVLVSKGFACPSAPRNVSLALYAASLALIVSGLTAEALAAQGRIGMAAFERFILSAVGGAALLFAGASVHFMAWVARSTREHEYHELLLARFVEDPSRFRMLAPSAKFTTRWSRNQSRVALFLVLAVPLTISPVFAAQQTLRSGETLVTWVALLFILAGIFHVAGTRLLIEMHNGHLRVEALNRETLDRTTAWAPTRTQSVLDETSDGAESPRADPGELAPRRVLATIMITDMVGYSREMQHSEDDTLRKLMKHNELVRAQLSRHGGREIKTMGDAFLVSFQSALDAVKAALDIQADLAAHNAGCRTDERIVIRIGMHTGEILTLDGDVLGNGVNIAARIEPLAEPGGICISSDTYEQVRMRIDIQTISLGRRELKNITNAPEILRVRPAVPA
jgi:class 3 adenylate cyclase